MTWTKDLMNTLDVFNVSNNLNLTNQHFVNMTKKIQTDLDKIQVITQKVKKYNKSRIKYQNLKVSIEND